MKDLNALSQVAEFHTTFKHPILEQPAIPSPERCQLRIDLIAEELDELREAVAQKDMVGIADALCDIQYVLAGAVHEFGLSNHFKILFDEVHRSNMSKACKTAEEAEETIAHYKRKDNVDAYYKEIDGLFLVYRSNDHKTLKSVAYSAADLESILK
ncbi:nucleoside triphosphate pyrophosphohydrolase family protein [Pedobacter montanisoli]|uniref:Nucleoside triphosphate pyrophosphohydrolase family protein n=1 Tax=Pedobacter montanisoli TaxID=2923277 RepID=A0ABS9ZXG5_9SPHI|nr:nucleoside triphosphate pyrophosphohydrolase family protein [Pedobacter montanisoli]MCJ0743019.1 nucleoside triphosphate pyrophosphohydrolase family protein [Pedobacter montanisoli]